MESVAAESDFPIHILIVTHARAKLLQKCLESVISEFGLELAPRTHIYLLENCPDPETTEIINQLTLPEIFPNFVRLNSGIYLLPGEARNSLLKEIPPGWIFFLDDDATLPPGYAETFFRVVNMCPWAQIIGGPNLNAQEDDSVAEATSVALASPWGTGPFQARYKASPSHEIFDDRDLILCNLWIRPNIKIQFNDGIEAGEENLILQDLLKTGHRGIYFDKLFVYHYRRNNFFDFVKQIHKYGVGRAEILHAQKKSWWIALGTLALMVFFIWLDQHPVKHIGIPGFLFEIYLALSLVFAFLESPRKHAEPVLLIFVSFLLLHLGFLSGVIRQSFFRLYRSNFK
jgi:glycosyltransferase involved in cell wall biosynthesis